MYYGTSLNQTLSGTKKTSLIRKCTSVKLNHFFGSKGDWLRCTYLRMGILCCMDTSGEGIQHSLVLLTHTISLGRFRQLMSVMASMHGSGYVRLIQLQPTVC